jgi:hypothetical protein
MYPVMEIGSSVSCQFRPAGLHRAKFFTRIVVANGRRPPATRRQQIGIRHPPVAGGCAPRPLLPAATALLNIGCRSAPADVARA